IIGADDSAARFSDENRMFRRAPIGQRIGAGDVARLWIGLAGAEGWLQDAPDGIVVVRRCRADSGGRAHGRFAIIFPGPARSPAVMQPCPPRRVVLRGHIHIFGDFRAWIRFAASASLASAKWAPTLPSTRFTTATAWPEWTRTRSPVT